MTQPDLTQPRNNKEQQQKNKKEQQNKDKSDGPAISELGLLKSSQPIGLATRLRLDLPSPHLTRTKDQP